MRLSFPFKALVCVWLLCTFLPCLPVFSAQANVFIYHRFDDSRYPSTNIPLEALRSQLQVLKDEQFVVLPLGEVVNRLQSGQSLPARCAAITVDDGYRSFLDNAWPLLREFGYPVTLFVSTDMVGGGDFLSWQEIRALQLEGVEIGNHSAAHDYMLDKAPNEAWQEWEASIVSDLKRSRDDFARYLNASPELFAYPYGEFSVRLARLVEAAGFRAAFGQQSGVITSGQDVFRLPRFPVGGEYVSTEEFRSKLFMNHLPVSVENAQDTIVTTDNPPVLRVNINFEGLQEESLRCYASGGLECQLREIDGPGMYEVKASGPIVSRRGKYTLTASDAKGQAWYWFSQLWVLPRHAVPDNLVPR